MSEVNKFEAFEQKYTFITTLEISGTYEFLNHYLELLIIEILLLNNINIDLYFRYLNPFNVWFHLYKVFHFIFMVYYKIVFAFLSRVILETLLFHLMLPNWDS